MMSFARYDTIPYHAQAITWIALPTNEESLRNENHFRDTTIDWLFGYRQQNHKYCKLNWQMFKTLVLRSVRSFSNNNSSNSTKIIMEISKPPLPPFTLESAIIKVQAAEDAWNSRNPERIALAHTEDTEWRNRSEFINGRNAIKEFLKGKWDKELDYRLKKELWCYMDNKIAVRFEYEYHDTNGNWYRSYGNENWEFAENGQMKKRYASINDISIQESERKFRWERSEV